MQNEESNTVAVRKTTWRSDRENIVECLGRLNRYTEIKFDLGRLSQLSSLSEQEFLKRMVQVMNALDKALAGGDAAAYAETEAPEDQVENLRTWQQQRSGYFQWNEYEHRQLLEHLQKHPGSVLIPNFAHACDIRESSGRVYTWRREGKVT
jgi:hypothetical protein